MNSQKVHKPKWKRLGSFRWDNLFFATIFDSKAGCVISLIASRIFHAVGQTLWKGLSYFGLIFACVFIADSSCYRTASKSDNKVNEIKHEIRHPLSSVAIGSISWRAHVLLKPALNKVAFSNLVSKKTAKAVDLHGCVQLYPVSCRLGKASKRNWNKRFQKIPVNLTNFATQVTLMTRLGYIDNLWGFLYNCCVNCVADLWVKWDDLWASFYQVSSMFVRNDMLWVCPISQFRHGPISNTAVKIPEKQTNRKTFTNRLFCKCTLYKERF